jgi:hypothetical protein
MVKNCDGCIKSVVDDHVRYMKTIAYKKNIKFAFCNLYVHLIQQTFSPKLMTLYP